MNKFLVITNKDKDKDLKLTKAIKSYIEEHGGSCAIEERSAAGDNPRIDIEKNRVDCALVLGGDGTIVRAARDMTASPVPMIGVNLGTLGYLCEVEEENVFSAIDRIMADDYEIEQRVKIVGSIGEDEGELSEQMALNDIVIYRAGNLQIVSLNVYVNGSFLCNYHADGLIIATPTGSTAYSMSAGGPIMDPKAEMIVITPVNAQAMSAKSIVIPSEDEVRVEVMRRNKGVVKEESVEIAFDGDNIACIGIGESIVIKQAPEMAKFLKLSSLSFIERLEKKMNVFSDRSNG